jgi:hypothetical protein
LLGAGLVLQVACDDPDDELTYTWKVGGVTQKTGTASSFNYTAPSIQPVASQSP